MTPSGEKKEIYYQDATIKRVLRDTTFTDRINVSGPANGAKGGVLLTINSVQLKDQLEFICIIKDLTGVVAEGRTQLKVFGKFHTDMFSVCSGLTQQQYISFKL